ncbi:thioredoxin-like fold domain-containing protein MRL7 homolog, chloroplastic [Zingiber officinale]|uniref:thioredoxin-like fold domain-containing protein MRL7 homolog, chloroplastic n=1 Tax=Zingiber officinale TaxID=94328 RepID=UPI001C4D33B5|nr:thioredoxin-like fold domain-containing protein MRL7 homolog, chloroplastic [Zingiber officinale]
MSLLQTLALQTPAFLRSKQASPFSLYFLSPNPALHPHLRSSLRLPKPSACISSSDPDPDTKPKPRRRSRKTEGTDPVDGAPAEGFVPRKPRRGRRSESAAVEDFVRSRLQDTFAAIREQNAGLLEGKHEVLKARRTDEEEEEEEEKRSEGEDLSVEDDDPEWPLDADVGWGIRASEYFEKNPIKNVVEEGVEIDWEGEMDEGWVKEINSLEWESFAYHPSPLVVLVFERYRRAAHNWRMLKELENAAKVYWSAKDRLPPRTIKIDINIERDLAYALKVKECPELLFLKGNTILYREKEFRTADELVQMIAHFYYNARRPSWVDTARVSLRC